MKNYILFIGFILFSFIIYAQPANDLCTNAQTITDLDGTCNSFSNAGATATNPYYPTCFSTGGGASQEPLVWFTFTAQGPNASITVTETDGTNNFSPEIALIGFPLGGGGDLCDNDDVVQYSCSNLSGNYDGLTLNINDNSLIPGEQYMIAVNSNNSATFDFCIDNPVNNSPSTCANAEPFCTEDGDVVFDAGVNDGVAEPGNNYDCLISQPNPAWFFLEIDNPGDLNLEFASNPARDIDYVAWGPFTDQSTACDNLTAANVVDCSFLAATTETASITGTQVGEVYMVMITNFSNNPTEITFSQTGGAATTNCAIVLPVELLSFNVSHQDNANVITWSTATEKNNDYFEVEYSNNGVDWSVIASVSGSGSTTVQQNYSTIHRNFDNSINYYRLRQIDYNGASDLFDPKSIDNTDGRRMLKTINLMGQEVDETYSGIVIIKYSDGTSTKVLQE